MDREMEDITELGIDELVPFGLCSFQTYEGERLEQLKNSIKRVGQLEPVIVRKAGEHQYEIICGHNRVKAMRELGFDKVRAYVKDDLPDNEAVKVFYESNLNQQSFSDWSYSQRIEAIKYTEKLIQENSQQGKRNDLREKRVVEPDYATSVQSRQKSPIKRKQATTRDKMARTLGISTATFSKYRKIIKLSDDTVKCIGQLLDQKLITFEAAYRISGLREIDIKLLADILEGSHNKKIDMQKLKALLDKGKKEGEEKGELWTISRKFIEGILVPRNS